MYQQHWTASLTPLMAVGVAPRGRPHLGQWCQCAGGLRGIVRRHVWVVAGPERDGVAATPYPDWPGSRAGIQRWCVQYRG